MGIYGLLFGLTAIANLALSITTGFAIIGVGMVRINLKSKENQSGLTHKNTASNIRMEIKNNLDLHSIITHIPLIYYMCTYTCRRTALCAHAQARCTVVCLCRLVYSCSRINEVQGYISN